MSNSKKLLITAFHPGGANAIVPVIKTLQKNKIEIVVIGYLFSENIFLKAMISFKKLSYYDEFEPTKKTMGKILDLEKPDLVIMGTSEQNLEYPLLIEHSVTIAATNRGIKTLAILDMWNSYVERFSDKFSGENFIYLPDNIAIMDDIAKKEMIDLGFKPEILHITGNPYFDSLQEIKGNFNQIKKNNIRYDLGINDSSKVIMFLTQSDEGGSFFNLYGYDRKTCFLDLIENIKKIYSSIPNLTLLIKVHPRDLNLDYRKLTNKLPFKVIIKYSYDVRECVLASDIIVGSFSTVLVEARVLNKIVISLQPGLKEKRMKDPLVTNKLGITYPVYKYNSLWKILEKAIINPELIDLKHLGLEKNSTQKIIALIENLLSKIEMINLIGETVNEKFTSREPIEK